MHGNAYNLNLSVARVLFAMSEMRSNGELLIFSEILAAVTHSCIVVRTTHPSPFGRNSLRNPLDGSFDFATILLRFRVSAVALRSSSLLYLSVCCLDEALPHNRAMTII